jgi:hypothetical protein
MILVSCKKICMPMRFKADFIIVMLKTNLKSNYPFQKYDMLESI